MPATYPKLLLDTCINSEESSLAYQFLTERHLQAMWLEQKYFKNLLTAEGEAIEILSPGIWNAEAGPDFRKAHIRIGALEMRGDIEMHLVDEGWQQHHHDLDERYDDVILHISLWKPNHIRTIRTKSGKQIARAYLQDSLTIPHARIVRLIDLDLYPYKRFVGSGKCAQTLFRTLPETAAIRFFKSAAEWRLLEKQKYLCSRIDDRALHLKAGMSTALGYKNNAEPFLELFIYLQSFLHLKEIELLAFSMLACGFFEAFYLEKWIHSAHYRDLHALSATLPPPTHRFKLRLNQIRPFNHPIRRLAFLAKLLCDPSSHLQPATFFTKWEEAWPQSHTKKSQIELLQNFQAMLPSYEDPYWNHRYLFEEKEKEKFLPLIGEDLKKEVLLNTFFPLLHERVASHENAAEKKAFFDLYARISASKSGKTRYLVHRFFGDTPKGAILNKADVEQGAFQLHRDFCLHFEASCQGCPFVERYIASPSKAYFSSTQNLPIT